MEAITIHDRQMDGHCGAMTAPSIALQQQQQQQQLQTAHWLPLCSRHCCCCCCQK